MDGRDPDWWWENATNLYEAYDSDPRVLLANEDYRAPKIKQTVSRERFLGLRGDKICPLWLRLMDEEVHPLEQIERISIPVDFHIVGITNKLAERDFDQYEKDDLETLRNYWRILCEMGSSLSKSTNHSGCCTNIGIQLARNTSTICCPYHNSRTGRK